jgi:hypothetical protein
MDLPEELGTCFVSRTIDGDSLRAIFALIRILEKV